MPRLKRASQKGLICGAGLSIQTVSGDVIHITESEVSISPSAQVVSRYPTHHEQATLIPVAEDISLIHLPSNVRWVLIVEKEVHTILHFNHLLHSRLGRISDASSITLHAAPCLETRKWNYDNRTIHCLTRLLC